MTTKYIMTDGKEVKSLDPFTNDTPGVWTGANTKNADAKSARLVPSMFAGITARMQAMSDLPFTIYSVKGDKPLDDSDNYKNIVGFLPYPSRTFSLSEGSLVVAGAAYWAKEKGTKTGGVKSLKYWTPLSVTLDTDKAKTGEVFFKRTGQTQLIPAKDVLYTWLSDPDVELGAPNVYPFASALLSAQAGSAIANFAADYMSRGAVKAMLLMVDGMPPPGEVERMESWFNRFMTGAKNLGWKVFNSAGVKPTVIGDGIEALRDMSISKDLRYEIHTALGTRHLLEDENFATAEARERQFYTITVVPDARAIQYSLNEQILHAMGYHLEFEPQRLEIFQTSEEDKASNFKSQSLDKMYSIFSQSMLPHDALLLSLNIVEYELSEEQQALLNKGLKNKENAKPDPPVASAVDAVAPVAKQDPALVKKLVELDKWEAKNKAAGKMVTWHTFDLEPEMVKAIKEGLSFDDARAQLSQVGDNAIKALADAINKAVESENKDAV